MNGIQQMDYDKFIMDAFTVSSSVRLPDYLNKMDLLGCNLNPVVVLTDFRKSVNEPLTPPPTPVPEKTSPLKKTTKKLNSVIKRDRHKSPHKTPRSRKRKGDFLDPDSEYEIENVVGYFVDNRNNMWYLVKWKNYSSKYNTFEPLDHLTNCNYKLMEFFEVREPKYNDISKMNEEVQAGLEKHELYQKLSRGRFNRKDLDELVQVYAEMAQLFRLSDANKLNELEHELSKEYECVVRALIGMAEHRDPGLFLRGQNYKLCLMVIRLRRTQLDSLREKEKMINSIEKTSITIENIVDLEMFPNITYISNIKPSSMFSKVPLLGCECQNKCNPRSHCCGKMSDSTFAYSTNGRLRRSDRFAIYECNSRCSCPETCPNRVVQKGRQAKLCIFKTKSCGWGVKTLERIKRGSFVCEYVGEVITDAEAIARDVKYLKQKRSGYLFNLDFFADSKLELYCIDATKEGNVARFINHSCDPNLVVYPVWIDNIEPNIHRLAFFARRNIQKYEEIRFDYENLGDESVTEQRKGNGLRMVSHVRCQCESDNCRKWVFGNS